MVLRVEPEFRRDVPEPRVVGRFGLMRASILSLEVGESVFFPGGNRGSVRATASMLGIRVGRRFRTAGVADGAAWEHPGEGGVAVWRRE